MSKDTLQPRAFGKKNRCEEDGGAIVEFALTMPFLILLLLGAVELSRVAFAAIQITNASRAAAQYGAQNTNSAADSTGMATAATNEATGLTGVSTVVSVSGICSSGAVCTGVNNGSGPTCVNTDCQTNAGDHIETVLTVTSSVSFSPGIRISAIPSSFTLSHTTVQKCLNC
jgi:Flp pilus assembly protein TadG